MTDIVPFTPTWIDIISPSVQLAERIAKTEFVPKSLQGRPEAVLAAILTGHEVGIGPMAALAKIHVVDGRPTMAAELMRALGLAAGHDAWVEDATTTRVIVAGRRHGSTHITKVTWTLDDAKKANLAGKANWQRYPRQMLLARATAELARLVWPDALGGIAYATEELDDGVEPTVATAAPPTNGEEGDGRGTRRRRRNTPPTPAAAPVTHHVGPELPALPGEEPPPPAGLTDAQRRKLHAALRDAGIADRADRIALAAGFIGRPLASSSDLTVDEASRLIDALEAVVDGRADLVLDDDDHPVGIRAVEAAS